MRSHLRSMAKRKVSDFLLREEGMVGNRSAFATAALVSTTALATALVVTPDAEANNNCGALNCGEREDCCWRFVNQDHEYACVPHGFCCPWEDPPGCIEP